MTRRVLWGVLFGVVVYAGIVLWSDAGALLDALSSLSWWAFPAALGCSLVNYALRFLKWQIYLRVLEVKIATFPSLLINLSAYSMGVTPGKVGEVLKSFLLKRVTGTSVTKSAPIVLAERVTDLLGCLVLIGAGGLVSHPEFAWVFWTTLGLCAALVAFLASERLSGLGLSVAGKLPLLNRVVERVETLLVSSRRLLAPKQLVAPTILSTLGWGAECIGFWILANGILPNGELSLSFATFAYATGSVVGALAIFLPGGLGATEYAMGTLFRREAQAVAEVSLETARALSVGATLLVRLATLWFGVVVGLFALAWFQKVYGAVEFETLDADER